MGERDKGEGRDLDLTSADPVATAHERGRKLRLLERLGEALGRPIEDFFESAAERQTPKDKPDGDGRE